MEPGSPNREARMSVFLNEKIRNEARRLALDLAKEGKEVGELAIGDAALQMTVRREDLTVVLETIEAGGASYYLGTAK
ncbi:hypothetical protein KBC55_01665 [Patescibacteria group bacterium]|nr:hypothetical protein [Patescibacteria group bacterium]